MYHSHGSQHHLRMPKEERGQTETGPSSSSRNKLAKEKKKRVMALWIQGQESAKGPAVDLRCRVTLLFRDCGVFPNDKKSQHSRSLTGRDRHEGLTWHWQWDSALTVTEHHWEPAPFFCWFPATTCVKYQDIGAESTAWLMGWALWWLYYTESGVMSRRADIKVRTITWRTQ